MASDLILLDQPVPEPQRTPVVEVSFARVDRKFMILETMSAEVSAMIMRTGMKRSRRVDERQLVGYR